MEQHYREMGPTQSNRLETPTRKKLNDLEDSLAKVFARLASVTTQLMTNNDSLQGCEPPPPNEQAQPGKAPVSSHAFGRLSDFVSAIHLELNRIEHQLGRLEQL
ncbi:MAG: hypothetical protein ACREGC_04215 [Minisyncoccia bacterium]